MEYLAGRTLGQKIGGKGMKLNDVPKCAIQIADSLTGAHSGGIVHRALRPANILITESGHLKVLDFRLASLMRPVEQQDASSAIRLSVVLGRHAHCAYRSGLETADPAAPWRPSTTDHPGGPSSENVRTFDHESVRRFQHSGTEGSNLVAARFLEHPFHGDTRIQNRRIDHRWPLIFLRSRVLSCFWVPLVSLRN